MNTEIEKAKKKLISIYITIKIRKSNEVKYVLNNVKGLWKWYRKRKKKSPKIRFINFNRIYKFFNRYNHKFKSRIST